VPGFEITIAAVAGDDVEITFKRDAEHRRQREPGHRGDRRDEPGAVHGVRDRDTRVRGEPGVVSAERVYRHAAPQGFVVTGGDLDGGVVRFVLAAKAIGTGTVYSSANYPFYWRVENTGQ